MMDDNIQRGSPLSQSVFPRSLGIKLYAVLNQYAQTSNLAFLDVKSKECLSYKDLFEQSVSLAMQLDRMGHGGKVICVCSENRPDFFVPIVAAMYLGSPVVTINHTYTYREISHACDLTEPEVVFVSPSTHSKFHNIKQQHNSMLYLQRILMLGEVDTSLVSFETLQAYRPVEVNTKEHVAAMLFSSGTSGMPKAVMITHHNFNTLHVSFTDPEHILWDMNNYISCVPFSHTYGFNICLATILRGITGKYMAKFNAAAYLSALQDYKVEFVFAVPSLIVLLAKHPLVDEYDLSAIQTIFCGGAACSPTLEQAVIGRLKNIPKVCQLYGMTEATLAVTSQSKHVLRKCGSVGVPTSGIELKIRDLQTHESLGPHKIGEICVRGDLVMKGYLGNTHATNETITNDKWLLTGDSGYFDDDGCFYIVDRLKDMIKFKGFQVAPAEVEALLHTHSMIDDAAVVGFPDETVGELPMAFVVKRPGVQLSEDDVKDFVKGQFSYTKQLHGGVRFVEDIPRTSNGKILRRKLRDLLTSNQIIDIA